VVTELKKGLGQLWLLVIEQEADEQELHLLPGGVIERVDGEFVTQALNAFVHPVVVKADALLHRTMDARPVAVFETPLGSAAGFAEQPVVAVEALDQHQRDLVRRSAIQADRDFHVRSPLAGDSSGETGLWRHGSGFLAMLRHPSGRCADLPAFPNRAQVNQR
jgi:hypothetical protein